MKTIDVAGRKVGPGHPCFVIAEAGVNHNGDLSLARQLVDVAVQAGADAVKFQTFKADKLATPYAPKAAYQQQTTDAAESQYDMLRRLELSPDVHEELFAYCTAQGILFMSTPFDEDSADFLDELGVAVFKIPSGEITNLPYLAHIARKGKPMIVSTGMSTLGEVEAAVNTIEAEGHTDYALLHCVSNYPVDPADVNLRAMQTLAIAFASLVGYSDHTTGDEVSLAAVAMGACVIEKHFTLDRHMPGPDHLASLEPDELTAMVRGIRLVEVSLGTGIKRPAPSEVNTMAVIRKSLVATSDLSKGTELTGKSIGIKRPGTGLPPAMLPFLIGRTLKSDVAKGTLITLDMIT